MTTMNILIVWPHVWRTYDDHDEPRRYWKEHNIEEKQNVFLTFCVQLTDTKDQRQRHQPMGRSNKHNDIPIDRRKQLDLMNVQDSTNHLCTRHWKEETKKRIQWTIQRKTYIARIPTANVKPMRSGDKPVLDFVSRETIKIIVTKTNVAINSMAIP